MAPKYKSFLLRYGDESEPIKRLMDLLKNREFDFEFRLAGDGGLSAVVPFQRLYEDCIFPIKLQKRGKKEYLVLVVRDLDDLLISVSEWSGALEIDFSEEHLGVVTIKNNAGDWYQIRVLNGNKE